MMRNNLKITNDARGPADSARSFSHDLRKLIQALNISRASIKPTPPIVIDSSGLHGDPAVLHEAWRYGVKIRDTSVICDWLTSLIE